MYLDTCCIYPIQPSRDGPEVTDEFFGCKAYLTVSGQLHVEAIARWEGNSTVMCFLQTCSCKYMFSVVLLPCYLFLLLIKTPQCNDVSIHIWPNLPCREVPYTTASLGVPHARSGDNDHRRWSARPSTAD